MISEVCQPIVFICGDSILLKKKVCLFLPAHFENWTSLEKYTLWRPWDVYSHSSKDPNFV
jgi:hypothetical protein